MEETKITLPPPRRSADSRRRASAVSGWVVAALLLGVLIGVLIGERRQMGAMVNGNQGTVTQTEHQVNSEVMKHLAEARVAMAAGQWLEARKLYLTVLAAQPDPQQPSHNETSPSPYRICPYFPLPLP